MSNLYTELLKLAADEAIEGVVIGAYDLYELPTYIDKVLSAEQAKPILDYEYDSGFGCADCHPFFAWTRSKVIFVHEYDGATTVVWVPRNPREITPEFGGIDE